MLLVVTAAFVYRRYASGLVAAGHDAAINVENRAGDPACLFGEQKGDGVGHVGRRADAAQGMQWRERRQCGVDRNHIGTTLEDPFIDYATVAKGLGVASFGPITDPNDLGPVLKKAVAVVKSGEPALVDVVSQGR